MLFFFSDEYDPSTGLLIRTCEENVAVNKCEGQCASSIYPSALNAYGFQKVITNGSNLLLHKKSRNFETSMKNQGLANFFMGAEGLSPNHINYSR